jgi:hypothetical protein
MENITVKIKEGLSDQESLNLLYTCSSIQVGDTIVLSAKELAEEGFEFDHDNSYRMFVNHFGYEGTLEDYVSTAMVEILFQEEDIVMIDNLSGDFEGADAHYTVGDVANTICVLEKLGYIKLKEEDISTEEILQLIFGDDYDDDDRERYEFSCEELRSIGWELPEEDGWSDDDVVYIDVYGDGICTFCSLISHGIETHSSSTGDSEKTLRDIYELRLS